MVNPGWFKFKSFRGEWPITQPGCAPWQWVHWWTVTWDGQNMAARDLQYLNEAWAMGTPWYTHRSLNINDDFRASQDWEAMQSSKNLAWEWSRVAQHGFCWSKHVPRGPLFTPTCSHHCHSPDHNGLIYGHNMFLQWSEFSTTIQGLTCRASLLFGIILHDGSEQLHFRCLLRFLRVAPILHQPIWGATTMGNPSGKRCNF